MHSVADRLRAESRRDLSRLTPAERVVLALELGARDLGLFAESQVPPLDRHVAARLFERRRQAGRRRSRCLEELIGMREAVIVGAVRTAVRRGPG